MDNNLLGELNKVNTKGDLSKFIMSLVHDLKKNKAQWENDDLSSFLEAMSAWVDDMDGLYGERKNLTVDGEYWKLFAEMLFAAKYYE
ncbi:hypothetical protein CWI84_06155 [Idiomarina tyrosinivorans]|uniref:DUF7660 domain-containing protein n=1 Tax=Idiomarina tyrosinivorans TaxID=1445662 RepID=A0A432ZQM9_9GAMM|nr:hypothetical protein [Idiomarina tyrosinivorans]RUO80214.1 hypothetical protein CWI84_06155 [Idiomarina tyrosinivorans]